MKATPAQIAADPRPTPSTPIIWRQGGTLHTGAVCKYTRGDGHRTFQAQESAAPYAYEDLMIGDRRIIEPAEYGKVPQRG
jgi:hypothetical protein